MAHERAGQPAAPADLIDVAHVVTAYYTTWPDVEDPGQRVAFGTSGHRGSSLDASFTEAHIVATTQAICDYRAGQGIAGPLFLGRDTHALSEPAWASALEVLAANEVTTLVDSRQRYTPTPALSHAIITHNRSRAGDDAGRADGIVVTPSHNPPSDGGFKYNPPHGGPADTDATGWIADRANELLRGSLRDVKRVPLARARAASTTGSYDYLATYVDDLPAVLDVDAVRGSGPAHRRGPARRRERRLLGRDRRAAAPRPHRREPAGRPDLAVHDAGLGRQDPDGLLVAVRDGLADRGPRRVRAGHRQRRRRRPARDRHAGRRPAEPQPLPRRRDLVPLRQPRGLVAGRRGRQDAGVVVDDRPGRGRARAAAGRGAVGFKWFVPGLLDGSVGFGGEESAGASFLRRDGSVWTTDKDGILLALLAAEITARTEKTPSEIYRELTAKHGDPAYARVDAPANREQKAVLAKLSPDQVTATELAGEPIVATLTRAPGNDAPIGGLKVVTENAWFAARPSGTEDVYKIYAESFKGPDHLAEVQAAARDLVSSVI
jgi:phosphoglucomutase